MHHQSVGGDEGVCGKARRSKRGKGSQPARTCFSLPFAWRAVSPVVMLLLLATSLSLLPPYLVLEQGTVAG